MKRILLMLALCTAAVNTYAQKYPSPQRSADDPKKWGYVIGDNWVVPARFERAQTFSDGLACVKLNNKYGFINTTGDLVIPYNYDKAYSFADGMAAVSVNGKWGFINRSGSMTIPYRYDEALSLSEGLAAVSVNGKWGFIDRFGNCVVPYSYDAANSFADGLAHVLRGNTWGFVDRNGKWYASKDDYIPAFSDYAKRYVEQEINKWQIKGKYEKTADWKTRVNDTTRAKKIAELTKEAEKKYITEQSKSVKISQTLGDYDADNEIFLVKDDKFGDLLVPVPIAIAPKFEEKFYELKRSVRYFVENDHLALAEINFDLDGNILTYSNAASLEYFATNVDYQFAPIDIDTSLLTQTQRGEQKIGYAQLSNSTKSDVDINIPQMKGSNDNTFAVVIANELYKHEEAVPFAKSDGESFRNYCIQTLGIPESRVHFCSDATLNEMRMAIHWVKDVGEAFGEEAKVLFYYAGHGVADDSSRSAFLLPVDGSGRDPESGYSVDKLYSELGDLSVGSVVVLLDACFSGSKRDGEMMVASRGVAIKPKESTLSKGNMIVLSATTGEETASLYPEKGLGLFTYFVLKKLQESRGNCNLKELSDYVAKRVNQESVVVYKRPQTPTVSYTPAMTGKWENITLR